ncbi:FkbM family methyltransferase [Jannaschia seohaensis]|uniref:FkbM family methyltransferase n=1 Tax=Jannaschia seohaensis TaxID=475081 RepID=A0A2Y9AQT7_9RHOB|nr:FkbM family methyltransferase [Jannaschia seohaensis]PWJ18316.1 FkbM family methyltransferase [Jannaschia seohaensis]SSA46841.1 methyltransferase, FkbM family [Jannaschia seohaensis]
MTRPLPSMPPQRPEGALETLLDAGRGAPGALGHFFDRKLRKRWRRRHAGAFDAVLATMGPGDVAVDLGANVGAVTRRLAATGATVHAYEPDPETFATLAANIADLPNVHAHQAAAGAQAAILTLNRSPHLAKNPGKYSQSASLVHDLGGTGGVEVEVIDFPTFLAGLDRDIALVKIDIEGAEWDLLDALRAHPVLARIDALFVETHERHDYPRLLPRLQALQAWAESIDRPYVNLFWH